MALSQAGKYICFADLKEYRILNFDNEYTCTLFPYDFKEFSPITIATVPGEFLLATRTSQGVGIGLFVSLNGDPVRGTLEWPSMPQSLGFVDIISSFSIPVYFCSFEKCYNTNS